MALYGGMESHLCLLARACAAARHRVTLVTTSNSLNDVDRQKLREVGVVLYELPVQQGQASRKLKVLWLMLISFRLRFTRWHIIYTNGRSSLARVIWFAGRRGTRIIHHHHTSADPEEIEGWQPAFRRVLQDAPELVACSRSIKHQLEATLHRLDVQFLPYLTPEILPPSAVKEKNYRPDTILNFGFVGRLVPTKGIEEICRLSRQPGLAMVRWHLYGESENYPAEYFCEFPNVIFHGRYRDLAHYGEILTGLDAMVLLSRHTEGMPLSLIEALSAGLPWVATDRGGTSEICASMENCIVIPTNATFNETESIMVEMAQRIRSGKTSRLVQRRAYDSNFSPESVAGQWLKFFAAQPN